MLAFCLRERRLGVNGGRVFGGCAVRGLCAARFGMHMHQVWADSFLDNTRPSAQLSALCPAVVEYTRSLGQRHPRQP